MDTLGWGFILWLIGYALGIILFIFMPAAYIGWVLTPIGTMVTLWVLFKKVAPGPISRYVYIGVAWLAVAVVCDYFFLVLLFKPEDGYYKLDVYLYYALALLLPILVGYWKNRVSTDAPAAGGIMSP